MTTATDITSTDEPARVLSVRTLRTYAADWALFTDWCAATDTAALPADPLVVVDFLTGCPAAAGFTAAQVDKLGGHSLRAGFVTEAFRAGADAHSIMRQTGHRSPVMLEVYAREHAPLVGNAVTRLGL